MSAYDDSRFGVLTYDMVIQNPDADVIEVDGIRWAKLEDYPCHYISDNGDIISFHSKDGRVLSTWPNQYGHRYTKIRDNFGELRHVSISREVCGHFNERLEGQNVVRHLNDDPNDNYFENLAWGTQFDNMQDCRSHNRMFMKKVYCYELNIIFDSCAEAAEYFGVSRSAITNCCKGKSHSIGSKFHLCYLDEKDTANARFDKCGNFKSLKATNVYTGETIIFRSRKEASEKLGLSDSGISNVITGRIYQTGGWAFEDMNGGEHYV